MQDPRRKDDSAGPVGEFHRGGPPLGVTEAGLPTPQTNVDIPAGHLTPNVDFFLAELGLVIEADGPEHELPAQQLRDRARDLALGAVGLHVLRFSYRDIERRPEAILQVLRSWAWRWRSTRTA